LTAAGAKAFYGLIYPACFPKRELHSVVHQAYRDQSTLRALSTKLVRHPVASRGLWEYYTTLQASFHSSAGAAQAAWVSILKIEFTRVGYCPCSLQCSSPTAPKLALGEIGPPSTHRPGSLKAGANVLSAPPIPLPCFARCCYRCYASRSLGTTTLSPAIFILLVPLQRHGCL